MVYDKMICFTSYRQVLNHFQSHFLLLPLSLCSLGLYIRTDLHSSGLLDMARRHSATNAVRGQIPQRNRAGEVVGQTMSQRLPVQANGHRSPQTVQD